MPAFETCRSVVLPSMCDHLGHMNVRWYAALFDDASFHLWTQAGISQREMQKHGVQAVAARTTNVFVSPLNAGDLVVIVSGFTKIGNKSVGYVAKMFNADTRQLAATQEAVEVFFDPVARASTAVPEIFRNTLSSSIVAADDIS
jgi:acyl-CoA thioester hydrolase